MRARRSSREPSVARQILVLQVLLVLVLVAAALGLAAYDARRNARATATDRAVAVATTLADSPTLVAALDDPFPSTTIQPLAERVRHDAGVDFVTVMNLDLIRYSHPDPTLIGRHFVGDVGDAPQGRVFTQEYAGTLGPSMRAVVPVRDSAGTVVALVSVGITIQRIDRGLRDDVLLVGLAALAVLAVGLAGTWLVARRLRRATHGMGEQEITRMYEYYSAVLHAVREGLLLL
ncbi:MAG: histidine kinase, partial [Nocardioides sp.]